MNKDSKYISGGVYFIFRYLLFVPLLLCLVLILHTMSPVVDILFRPAANILVDSGLLISSVEAMPHNSLYASSSTYTSLGKSAVAGLDFTPQRGGNIRQLRLWPQAWLPFIGNPDYAITRYNISIWRWAYWGSLIVVPLMVVARLLLPVKLRSCPMIVFVYLVTTIVITMYATRFIGYYSFLTVERVIYNYNHPIWDWYLIHGFVLCCVVLLPPSILALLLGLTYGFPKRRPPQGHCGQCGYDCKGLAICPECGNTDPAARPSQGIRYFFRPVTYFSLFVCSLFLPSFVSLGIKLVGAITG